MGVLRFFVVVVVAVVGRSDEGGGGVVDLIWKREETNLCFLSS